MSTTNLTEEVERIGRGVHAACFYRDDSQLVESLCRFVQTGLDLDEVVVLIVTRPHRAALETMLRARGVDVTKMKSAGKYAAFDAAETLSLFMRNGMPSEMLFSSLVKPLFASFARQGTGVRGYGEMVALLWNEGNTQGAAALEQLGTQLGKEMAETCPLTLLCAYPKELSQIESYKHATACVHQEHDLVLE